MMVPDEEVRVGANPGEDYPHQGGAREVEAQPVLPQRRNARRDRVRGQAAPVFPHQGERHPPVHPLQGVREPFPEEGGTQDGVAGQNLRPGPLEGGEVEPLQGAAETADVDRLPLLHQGVEEHPLLHGGEGVEVLDLTAGTLQQAVEGLRVEPAEGEVRRGVAARLRSGAVGDQLAQYLQETGGHRFHCLRAVQARAIGPGQAKPPAFDSAVDLQQVAPETARAPVRAARFAGPAEEALLSQHRIELAQVVERHLGLRQPAQLPARAGVGRQVAQQPVTDPPPGYPAELLLHPLERVPRPALPRLEERRGNRGEPADGAGEIEPLQDLLPPVPLDVDQRRRGSRPATERPRQGGQQEIVDPCAVGSGCFLEEETRRLGVELGCDPPRRSHPVPPPPRSPPAGGPPGRGRARAMPPPPRRAAASRHARRAPAPNGGNSSAPVPSSAPGRPPDPGRPPRGRRAGSSRRPRRPPGGESPPGGAPAGPLRARSRPRAAGGRGSGRGSPGPPPPRPPPFPARSGRAGRRDRGRRPGPPRPRSPPAASPPRWGRTASGGRRGGPAARGPRAPCARGRAGAGAPGAPPGSSGGGRRGPTRRTRPGSE